MKKVKETVGIDASKAKLDAYLHTKALYAQFSNDQKGFQELVTWVCNNASQEVLFCFEHTGVYTIPLAGYLSQMKIRFAMIPALEIKKSMGMVRGKNDKVDAKRIAEYAYLRKETIKLTVLPSSTMQNIRALLSLRDRMVVQRAGYITSINEMKIAFSSRQCPSLFKEQEKQIKYLTKSIDCLEEEISKLIKADPIIHNTYKLIISVKGIGPVVAANLLAVTNGFTSFKSSRQLACYCGIAPFEKQSGSSIRSRSRVSHYANKKMKTLLNLAATNVINNDAELKAYYNKRIEAGKSKMSTINIIRNKLLHRVFAVIKRGTPYVEMQRWAAA